MVDAKVDEIYPTTFDANGLHLCRATNSISALHYYRGQKYWNFYMVLLAAFEFSLGVFL